MTLSPPAEVLLSYLTGLAPVGQTFEPRVAHVMADLGYRQHVSIYRCLSELIAAGCVKKHIYGGKDTLGLMAVTKRLENIPAFVPPKPMPPTPEVTLNRVKKPAATRSDWFARLAEIPADTRDLTGRLCGDPIAQRSALYLRQQQEHA